MSRGGRQAALVVGGVLLFLLLVVAYVLPVPYVRFRPGPVFNALGEVQGEQVISVEGARTFETEGSLDVTTVYEEGGPGSSLNLFQALRGWLDPAMSVVPRELLYPPEDFENDNAAEQVRQQGIVQMQTSEQSAVVAALRHLGEPVDTIVVVDSTSKGAPADGVLQPGDEIVRVQGNAIDSPQDVRKQVSSVSVGDDVTMTVRREGAKKTLTVGTVESTDDPPRPIVGVLPAVSYDSDIDINIALANVGGPSAGLMFALSIVDKLTPGALVAGRDIAGTGTIAVGGRVGPIGGIIQKLSGARDHGAEYFLAPIANCDEVVGHIPDGLSVVAIKSLDQAVAVLEKLDEPDAALPSCEA